MRSTRTCSTAEVGYGPPHLLAVAALAPGDLIEVDPDSGDWAVVEDDPVDDAADPGRITVSWRAADDQAGAICLPDDECVTAAPPWRRRDRPHRPARALTRGRARDHRHRPGQWPPWPRSAQPDCSGPGERSWLIAHHVLVTPARALLQVPGAGAGLDAPRLMIAIAALAAALGDRALPGRVGLAHPRGRRGPAVSGRDRDVLARAALENVRAPACDGAGALWNTCEAAHAARRLDYRLPQAAAAALVELCAICPTVEACRTWAATEAYTGIAAASAWVDGRPRPVDLVHRQGDARRPARPRPR